MAKGRSGKLAKLVGDKVARRQSASYVAAEREADRHRHKRDASARRQRTHAEVEHERRLALGTTQPDITKESAREFAKLLASGAPADVAIRYLHPAYVANLDARKRSAFVAHYAASSLVLDAVNALNGGVWHELAAPRRLELSLDKYLAENAYFLYTHNYSDLSGEELKKADAAAQRLIDYLSDADGATDSPWQQFINEFMKVNGYEKLSDAPAALPVMES